MEWFNVKIALFIVFYMIHAAREVGQELIFKRIKLAAKADQLSVFGLPSR
ncbi:hypothetical protein KOXY103107_01815 [Komagataeibacter xylinus]